MDPEQTAPIGAVRSGSTLFASKLEFVSNVRKLLAADDFCRRHFSDSFFLGALRVKWPFPGGQWWPAFSNIWILSPLINKIFFQKERSQSWVGPLLIKLYGSAHVLFVAEQADLILSGSETLKIIFLPSRSNNHINHPTSLIFFAFNVSCPNLLHFS